MHAARVQPQRQLPPRGELRAGARRLRRRAQRGRGRRQRAVAREEREARVRARPRRRCAAQAPRACAHTTLLRVLFGLWGPTGCTCGLAGSISRSACIQGWGKSARRAGTAHGNHCRSRARARAASEQPGAPGPTPGAEPAHTARAASSVSAGAGRAPPPSQAAASRTPAASPHARSTSTHSTAPTARGCAAGAGRPSAPMPRIPLNSGSRGMATSPSGLMEAYMNALRRITFRH